jgi:hypothetical protein
MANFLIIFNNLQYVKYDRYDGRTVGMVSILSNVEAELLIIYGCNDCERDNSLRSRKIVVVIILI